MKAVAVLALLAGCFGCHHSARHTRPEAAYPREPVRPRSPKLTLTTNSTGPIRYQWASTNLPDGTRVFQFKPEP
ncbi:MAG TPA: hypothetical protein VJA21_06405 [Verrucomicrobiae bacterium]